MGYIIVTARLPGIYGDVNRPCPRATPSDSGRFTAINPWPRAITITYTVAFGNQNLYIIKFVLLLNLGMVPFNFMQLLLLALSTSMIPVKKDFGCYNHNIDGQQISVL